MTDPDPGQHQKWHGFTTLSRGYVDRKK
jgi:hypothetical protein